jgi:RNA polymerase sigma-70 factor (ECF subfamily)
LGLLYAEGRKVGDADSLLDILRSGDRDAFQDALRPLVKPALRLALGMLDDAAAAEDAVQESSLRAWQKVGSLRELGTLRPWFLSIVANECRRSRRRRRWTVGLEPAEEPAGLGPEAAVLQGQQLSAALKTLNRDQRLVVTLHYYLDVRLEDIAPIVRAPIGTVKSRLARALDQLRPLLEQYE